MQDYAGFTHSDEHLKLHELTPVESFFPLRRGVNLAEAEFSSLSIPTRTGGEFREGGLKRR